MSISPPHFDHDRDDEVHINMPGEAVTGSFGEIARPLGEHLHLDQALDAWSPESPRLYELRASLGASALLGARGARSRRFARRSLEIREERVLLNGEAVFMHGVLYQGYWPESLLTPPDASAVERDLRAIKACGFNTVRVHAVVMSTTFYSLCDELGLMVWQDLWLPSSFLHAIA
eukprot:g21390.t2